MSRDEDSIGAAIAEKFLALLIILLGSIVVYLTAISPDLTFSLFFAVGGLSLIILGIATIIAKIQ